LGGPPFRQGTTKIKGKGHGLLKGMSQPTGLGFGGAAQSVRN